MREVSGLRVVARSAYGLVCRCKKAVVAEKRFTVHDAPAVLTIHLKRFSPLGRKIGHPVHYDERLVLQPAMSEGQHGPSYSLYGIICHAGGGPNSGHYFAHVKAANGRWYEMNDDMVSPQHGTPVGMKNAYILFYMRDRGQSLEGAISRPSPMAGGAKGAIVGGMKKRKNVDLDEEDVGVKAAHPFIGPLLPSPIPNDVGDKQSVLKTSASDPQAVSLQKKIAAIATRPSTALMSLAQYDEDDSSDSSSESMQQEPKVTTSLDSSPPPPPSTDSPQSPSSSDHTSTAQIPAPSSDTPRSSGIDPGSFYASHTKNEKKRKSPFGDEECISKRHAVSAMHSPSVKHTPHGQRRKSSFGDSAVNPYSRLTGNNTLRNSDFRHRPRQYGNKRKRVII